MEVITPVGDPPTDAASNTTGRHGDVDKNGDLVDLATELRLLAAITAPTPAEENEQLRAVVGMLNRHGFVEVPA